MKNKSQRSWTDEQLIEISKTAKTLTEILDRLGLSRGTKNYRTLEKYGILLNLNLPKNRIQKESVVKNRTVKKKYDTVNKKCKTCDNLTKRSRTYCEACYSEYLNKNKNKEMICMQCHRTYIYDWKKGHTLKKCSNCAVNKTRLESFKQECVDYKGGKCEICGYHKCLRSLHFHHKNPKEKDFGISGNHGLSWDKIVNELDKCVLLCSNCHFEVHDGLIELP